MLIYCWASVEDAGPTVKQHWITELQLGGMRPAAQTHIYLESREKAITSIQFTERRVSATWFAT